MQVAGSLSEGTGEPGHHLRQALPVPQRHAPVHRRGHEEKHVRATNAGIGYGTGKLVKNWLDALGDH